MIIKINGTAITNRTKKNTVNINTDKNKTRSCEAVVWYSASQTFPDVGQDFQVLEGTDIRFGGTIKTISYMPETPQQGTSAIIGLKLYSDGYNAIPQRRTVSNTYQNTTAGAIVSSLIVNYLYGEGISAGTISTGAPIEGYGGKYLTLKNILDDMAEASGYEWNINNDKELDFIDPTTLESTTDEINEGERTHFNFKPHKSLGIYRNKQFVEGGIDVLGDPVRVVVSDATEISARQTAEGGSGNSSGVYGNVFRDTTLVTDTEAEAVADELLARNKFIVKATFSSYEEYEIGKTLKVTYPKFGIATDTLFLVTKISEKRSDDIWIYSYSIEQRDTVDYSSKASDNSVDFFTKLSKTANPSTSSASVTAITPIIEDVNASIITLVAATAETRSVNFETVQNTYSIATIDAEINVATDAKVTIDIKQDSVTEYSRTVHIDADIDTLNLTTSLPVTAASNHTIEAIITSDTAGTIAADRCKLYVQQFVNGNIVVTDPDALLFTINMATSGTYTHQGTLANTGGEITVDWDDGTIEKLAYGDTFAHTYSASGEYQITIKNQTVANTYRPFFKNDTNVISIDTALPVYSSVSISELFKGATNLVTVPLNLFYKYVAVTTGVEIFKDCTSLVNMPRLTYLVNITTLHSAFYNCSSLESVLDSPFDGLTLLTTIQNVFLGCDALTNAPSRMFKGCSVLQNAEDIFNNCDNLITIPSDFSEGASSTITTLRYAFNLSGIVEIEEGAFDELDGLLSIQGAFGDCLDLETIPEDVFYNSGSLTNVSLLFNECESIVTLPSRFFDPAAPIDTFNRVFLSCSGITNNLPEWWNIFTPTTTTECFNGCGNASNFADVPSAWK